MTGIRTDEGLCLIGVDYTAHDGETMRQLSEIVDGILWMKSLTPQVEFEYRVTRSVGPDTTHD
jgi:hypothetical protein